MDGVHAVYIVSGFFLPTLQVHLNSSILLTFIRGVHMISAFAYGKISELGKSVAQRPADDDEDWLYCQDKNHHNGMTTQV